MAKQSFILIPTERAWRVAAPGVDVLEVPIPADGRPADGAADVAAALRQLGYAGQGVMLALPSTMCLAASISLDGLPRGDREAMAYRLEEKLPVAAESVVADFVVGAAGDAALGVCALTDVVAPIVESLESVGVWVQSVAPLAVLALERRAGSAESELLTWAERDRVNLFMLKSGRPIAWSLVSSDAPSVALEGDLIRARFGESSRTNEAREIESAAVAAADEVLRGRARAWVELRRGRLSAGDRLRASRRPINATLVAAAVLLLAVTAGMVYRGWQYGRLAESYDSKLREDFRTRFSGWAEPANVGAVVASERRKVEAAGAGGLPAEARESALSMLHGVLSKVPPDAGVTFTRATFNDTSIQLEGDAKSQADVEPLVRAARSAGLEAPPALTRKTAAGTWSFVVRGDRPAGGAGTTSSQGEVEP